MDEVLFHLSQNLEALQVHLYSGVQSGRLLFQNYSEQAHDFALELWVGFGPRRAHIREGLEKLWEWMLEVALEFRQITSQIFQPQHLFGQLFQLLESGATRTSLCFCCIGFLVGGIMGIAVGLCWHQTPPTVQRMKAVVCNSYRGLDSLAMVDDVPTPVITAPDEILVQVKASSVDCIDIKICSGYGRVLRKQLNTYNNNVKSHFPVVLGRDCAGIVVELGQKVTKFDIGDEVWCAIPYWLPGTMSEFVVIKESLVAKKPKGVGFEVAASLPYAGTIAWNAMTNEAGLNADTTPGKRILVHTGSTPVGCVLIQLARLWGGHVTTTCSLRATPVAQALGAHEVVVCGNGDVDKQLGMKQEFDVIFNTVGMIAHESCLKFCRPEGLVITTVMSHIASDMYGFVFGSIYTLWVRVKYYSQSIFGASSWGAVCLSTSVLDQLSLLIEDGSLQPVVDKIFSPQDAELAFQHADSDEAIGKTVIRFRLADGCTCGAYTR